MSTNKQNTPVDLIVYGGAFDPPHLGHLGCVRTALQKFPGAKILITPGAAPASIQQTTKHPKATFQQRVEMCELNFVEYLGVNGSVEICRIEEDLPTPNYTIKTLSVLHEKYPHKNLGLMLGTDQLRDFHLWYQPQAILQLASLIVVSRQLTEEAPANTHSIVNDLRDQLKLDNTQMHVEILDAKIPATASSRIRSTIATGEVLPHDWLHTNVMTYIQRQHLYADSEQA